MLEAARLREILSRLPAASVGVMGDFCLDAYWQVDMRRSERSLETGKDTHPVRAQRYSLGGAGNVVANLRALGVGCVAAFGVVGADPFGLCLAELLRGAGVTTDGVLVAGDPAAWQTLVYCKPHVGDEELSRLDMGGFNSLPDALADALLERLEAALPSLDVVVVNEQVEAGIHRPRLRQGLRSVMQRWPGKVFIFDGRHDLDSYPDAWLKLNAAEACRLAGTTEERPDQVRRADALAAARTLHTRSDRPVFVTRCERGCLVAWASGVDEIPGLQVLGRTDPVGAGDSFLAGVAAAVAVGATPVEAAVCGNFTAGVTVQKLFQTGTATPEEILAIGLAPDYVFRPELADDPRQARYAGDSEIEIVATPRALRVSCALFDHDGTLSTLRQGWEDVMEPVMIRAILGPQFDEADEALYGRVVRRVREYVDQTTGIQTITQMEGLVGMVHEFGCVPAGDIRDAAGYKHIYNDALMKLVRQRLVKFSRGELGVEDLTLKGAVAFLHRLRASGVRLYLASGTDRHDVVAEATALGYAELFEGRIYGAESGSRQEAKKTVIGRILAELGPSRMCALAAFGDGPVEIRETRKAGGLTVGVASDEVRRFGLNPDKRRRLIRAGADLVVPDFSQADGLLPLLGLPV
jgi:bifunctional ADP-heptose synthase (sugar kinase/adenylyltransferase)/phosphoglycolate phosphatase-like HAD superfamily hydrolase